MDSNGPLDSNLEKLCNHMSKYLLHSKNEIQIKYIHIVFNDGSFIKNHGYSKIPAKPRPANVVLHLTHLPNWGASYSTVNCLNYLIKWMHDL